MRVAAARIPEHGPMPEDAADRGWGGLHAGDPRTQGLGIAPLKPERPKPE